MFERFTERSRQVIVCAQSEARTMKHQHIGAEHILLGLLSESDAVAARVLTGLGLTLEATRAAVIAVVGEGDTAPTGQIPFTPRAKQGIELALREALSLGHNYIGTEHLLLALIRQHEGVAARILLDFDADSERIRNEVMRASSGSASLCADESERWAEYVICERRGHTPEDPHVDRKRCVHCGTTYWTEAVQREAGAPARPADAAAA